MLPRVSPVRLTPSAHSGNAHNVRREPVPSLCGFPPVPSTPTGRSIAVRAVTHHARSVVAQTSLVAVCIAVTTAIAVVWVLRAQRADPPSLADASAWLWISTAPGINVYIHERSREHSTQRVKAWVAFRYSNSPVSVNADVIELREFDCRQFLSRRLGGPFRGSTASEIAPRTQAVPLSAWRHDAAESMAGRILERICATSD